VYKYSPWNPVFPKSGTEEVMGEATWNHVKVSQAHQILLGGKVVYVPPPILLDIKRLMFTELSKAITADTEVVVETGSGWSRNIFYLTETGLLRNKNIRVYSGEFSVSGRKVCRLLSYKRRMESGDLWPVHCFQFDYYHSATSLARAAAIEKLKYLPSGKSRPGRALLYSHASIEQIHTLPEEYLRQLLIFADKVTVIHNEPLAHQVPDDGTDPELYKVQKKMLMSKQESSRFRYNSNLWSILKKHEKTGLIKIVHWKSNAVSNRVANGFVYVKYIKLREPTSQDFP
jgi:hypothetical protein